MREPGPRYSFPARDKEQEEQSHDPQHQQGQEFVDARGDGQGEEAEERAEEIIEENNLALGEA
jgi:hypothetical protein